MEYRSDDNQESAAAGREDVSEEIPKDVPVVAHWWRWFLGVVLGDIFICIVMHVFGFVSLESDTYYKQLTVIFAVLVFLGVVIIMPIVGYRVAKKRQQERKRYINKPYLQEYLREEAEKKAKS